MLVSRWQRSSKLRLSLWKVNKRGAACAASFSTEAATAAMKQEQQQQQLRQADQRLAGRRRFYKFVGVESVPAPWDSASSPSPSLMKTVESPVSAGVDGTQSASGVVGSTEDSLPLLKKRLNPRVPGDQPTSGSNDDEERQWFGVTLDGRLMKTPLGQTLALPSEILAWAIAAEWDRQIQYLQPAQMPLMTLACTTLDQTASRPDITRRTILSYLPTDTICFYTDPTDGDRVLKRNQDEAWNKIHDVCQAQYFDGHAPAKAMGASEGILLSRKRVGRDDTGLPHPTTVKTNAHTFVDSLDSWHLTAMSSVTMEAKSFLVGLAFCGGHISPDEAATAARVEEEFQISHWGLVEGGHDYDRLNCRIQMQAAHLLTQSLRVGL